MSHDRQTAGARWTRHLRIALLTVLVSVALVFTSDAGARIGAYRLAILRVSHSDASTHLWTLSQYQHAATEIHDFYARLSYGQLNMQVGVADVNLPCTAEGRVGRGRARTAVRGFGHGACAVRDWSGRGWQDGGAS
jgi:hypothetical protein